ncbi:hypothetical protein SDC9_14443 [bioreactor metagenome]|uniref:Uncharacterized protein n=1 Tax=bioreactor metagenome TaxID=1076179 RepID=A0A644TP07_9ZZZZ|nr:hypothetical protein [Desulfovibrio desulfuricans]MEA4990697.1 hypothetical protein [Desulfovibrio desulfuricans]
MDISWTSILTGAFSGFLGGIIPAAVAYYMGKQNVEASLKINAEKIDADRENLKLQLEQKEKELAAQFKLQTEKLHSDDIKRVCSNFLSCTNPTLFANNTFVLDTMIRSIAPLYMHCDKNYFSYFNNIIEFISERKLSLFGDRYEELSVRRQEVRRKVFALCASYKSQEMPPEVSDKIQNYFRETWKLGDCEEDLDDILALYEQHYNLALDAAKKLIWNEPIEEAPPLQWCPPADEDDI